MDRATGCGALSALAYPVRTAAQLLSISPRQLYRLLNAGELEAIKTGRTTLVLRTELVRFLGSRPKYRPPDER